MDHTPFGAFNPRFYGVSLHLSNRERLSLQGHYADATTGLSDWASQNGSPSLDDVAVISAIDHEVRHFHDFLVSPLGAITMASRMQASINGFHVLNTLAQCPGMFVPVPLTRWIEWDTGARERWFKLDGIGSGIGQIDQIVALPHAPDVASTNLSVDIQSEAGSTSEQEFLNAAVMVAAQAYASMEVRRKHRASSGGLDVSADEVFEGAAHLVQTQAAWSGQSEVAAHTLLNYIMTSSAKLLAPLQWLLTVMQVSIGRIDIERATALFTWMLLGPSEGLLADGHPGSRYLRVLELATRKPVSDVISEPMPVARLFDRLDELTQSPSWRNSVATASSFAGKRRASYDELARSLTGGYFDALFAVASAWHDDQLSAKQTFLQDPESLASPNRYLNEQKYPLPFIETRLGMMVHQRKDTVDSNNHRVIAIDDESKQVLSYISSLGRKKSRNQILSYLSSLGRKKSRLTIDDVLGARLVTHMTDFVFADEPLDDLYEHWCRKLVERQIGKKLVSVY
jgi:hypothetical protein